MEWALATVLVTQQTAEMLIARTTESWGGTRVPLERSRRALSKYAAFRRSTSTRKLCRPKPSLDPQPFELAQGCPRAGEGHPELVDGLHAVHGLPLAHRGRVQLARHARRALHGDAAPPPRSCSSAVVRRQPLRRAAARVRHGGRTSQEWPWRRGGPCACCR